MQNVCNESDQIQPNVKTKRANDHWHDIHSACVHFGSLGLHTGYSLSDMAMKINFVLFERTFKVIYEDPLQLFRTLFGFRNILNKNSVQSAILVL
jgi:hypothetical protein